MMPVGTLKATNIVQVYLEAVTLGRYLTQDACSACFPRYYTVGLL